MKFSKYSSAGNDFLLIDEREGDASKLTPEQWEKVCCRALGVGADGVLFFSRNPYGMHYINSDGHEAEMCGNGLRAICHYILSNEDKVSWPIKVQTKLFLYTADYKDGKIWVEMADISESGKYDLKNLYKDCFDSHFINTGVPHAVFEVKDISKIDLKEVCPPIRHSKNIENGANVDFYQVNDQGKLSMRVFERGVEDETKSSGTGTTAVALAYRHLHQFDGDIEIETQGGEMQVSFENGVPWLTGPVVEIYQAELGKSFLESI